MKTKQIIIRLSEEEKERAVKYAKKKELSISQLIRNYLKKLNSLN